MERVLGDCLALEAGPFDVYLLLDIYCAFLAESLLEPAASPMNFVLAAGRRVEEHRPLAASRY